MPPHSDIHERPVTTYASALLLGAVLFGVCNLTWRLGSGDTVGIVLQRSFIGLLFVLPVLWRAGTDGRLRAIAADRWGVAAVAASGATLVSSGFLFRLLPGPQAGLVIAIVPALLLVPSRLLTGRSLGRALPFVLLSVLAAMAVPFTGGVGEVTAQNAVVAAWFVLSSMAAKLTLEQARRRHGSWILVAAGVAAGTAGTALVVVAGPPEVTWSMADLAVAVVIAVLGTLGRVLQTFSLPHLGSVVTSSASQVTAAITAAGGVLLFADAVSRPALVLGLVAAAAAIAATVSASIGTPPPAISAERSPRLSG